MGRRGVVVIVFGLAACMPSHDVTPELAVGRSCPDLGAGTWYFTEAAAGQDRLEDWCRTVGPPVVAASPGADFGPLKAGSEVDVVSWNVAIGRGDVLEFLDSELGLACSGPASKLAAGASHFALLLQEAFRRSDEVPDSPSGPTIPRAVPEEGRAGERLDAVEVARRCGLSLAYVPASRNGSEPRDGLREDKGVAILSTLPLEQVFFVELPYEAARRVAVAATVRDESGTPLRLANLHLISMAGPSRALTTGNGSRLRQGLAAAEAVDRADARPPATATILAGDFNTWSDRETTLLRLRDRFPDSPPALGEGTHGAFPTDHILFRAAAGGGSLVEGSYDRLDAGYGSDHFPVRVRVSFPR
jgi:endonuclease/exonuclease/phosphatase family metal-dependent hydrolase